MTGRMDRFSRIEGVAEVSNKIEKDPSQGALFEKYIKSLRPSEQLRVREIATKRHTRQGLTEKENEAWQLHSLAYSDRLQRADNLLANLKDQGVQRLGEALAKQATIVKPTELPIFIRGLSAGSTGEDDDPFVQLNDCVISMKTAARDDKAEKISNAWDKQLDTLAKRYKVPPEELERMIDIRDDKDRFNHLKGAVGKVGFFKTIAQIAQQPYLGTRAGALNAHIKKLRAESSELREGLNSAVQILSKIDTTTDGLWQEIPEVLQRQKDIDNPHMTKEAPLSLETARELTSEKGIRDEWKKIISKLNDGAVEVRFNELRKANAASPADTWRESVDVGGGNMKTFEELYEGIKTLKMDEIENRGYASAFVQTLREPLVDADFVKAKARLERI